MKTAILLGIALLAVAADIRANDGFGGISAKGLEFAQNDKVAMKSEDLFISLDKIKVSYVFANTSDEDVTGEVIFPLPPIGLLELMNRDSSLPEDADRENLVNFTVEVDGDSITPGIERRAVRYSLAPESGDPVNGEDVTTLLKEAGVPLTLKPARLVSALDDIPPAKLEKLVSAGLLTVNQELSGMDRYVPNWAITIRYHWNQTFPASTEVTIRHEYENYPPGGIWSWSHPATEDYQREIEEEYCIDEETSKALTRCREACNITYILGTADTWKGPIGNFTLTIDKGDPRNILSLCADGVEKTGPTTFVLKKRTIRRPSSCASSSRSRVLSNRSVLRKSLRPMAAGKR